MAGGGAAMEDVEVDGERERRRGQQRGRQVRRGEEVAGEAGGGARPSSWGAAWRLGADRWAPPLTAGSSHGYREQQEEEDGGTTVMRDAMRMEGSRRCVGANGHEVLVC